MPPKRKNKPSKNGFWQFVLEVRDKQTNKNMSLQEIQDFAGRKWTTMSKEERKPYEDRALMARNCFSAVKYTTDGLEIAEVERQEKEVTAKQQAMKNDITNTLKTASLTKILDEQVFLIIHVNHLTHYPAEDKYYICEIAIAVITLKNGIETIFHRIVKPGKLPLGYYGGALAHSKETHQLIEIVQDDPYDNNTREVFFDIIHLMRQYSPNRQLPILYADEKTLEMTKNVFQNFTQEFEFEDEIKIYNLQVMFYALRNAAAGRTVWPTESFSYSEIEKDVYSYCPNISCDYHEVADISVYCSKAIVTRYAFTICDNCCSDLNIQLIAGRHVPEKSRILNEPLQANSRTASVTSSEGFGKVSRDRMTSISSRGYEENYPPLGSYSSASSLVSFSSMKTSKSEREKKWGPAEGVEESFRSVSLNEPKRDHKNLKFPEHGYKKRAN